MEYFDTRLERAKKAFDEKKNSVDLGKKKTDITGYGWEKSIKNRLF